LQDELNQVKQELSKQEKLPWVPDVGGNYYTLYDCGSTQRTNYFNDSTDIARLSFGNVFKTKEDAEAWAKVLKVFNKMRQLGATGGRYCIQELEDGWDVYLGSYGNIVELRFPTLDAAKYALSQLTDEDKQTIRDYCDGEL